MSKKTTVKHIALTAICAAVLAACGGGGGASTSTDLVNNATSARQVIDIVEGLPSADSLTVNDVPALNAAINRYNRLSDSEKGLVSKTSFDKLQSLVAVAKESETLGAGVIATLSSLPTEVAQSQKSAVESARAQYDALTEAQKTWVTESAVQHLAQSEANIAANTANASTFAKNVEALPAAADLTKTNAEKVENVRQQHEAFSAAQKSYVSDAALAGLSERETTITNNAAAAQKVADSIGSLADKIVNLTGIETKVEAPSIEDAEKEWQKVNAAFGALTDNQKTWLDSETVAALNDINSKVFVDNAPLAALNPDTPLSSKFLLADEVGNKAQHENPDMQLRKREDGELKLLTNQTALIKEIALNGTLSEQDSISIRGITFQEENMNPGEPAESAKISKINAQTNLGEDIDVSHEVAYRFDKNKEVLDRKWNGIYAIKTSDGVTIILRDPAVTGWKHQTFAHYSDPANNIVHAYQSIGAETPVAAMPTSGTATYTGITTAYLVETGKADRQLTADVKAVADFAKKGLRFETSNAQFHALNNGVRESQAADGYNMKGSASWSANSNSFKGTATADNQMKGQLLGKFYGAQAAEIGGTYGLQNADNSKQLIGGYGAKRP